MKAITKITVLCAGLAAAIPFATAATSASAPTAKASAGAVHHHAGARAHRMAFRHMARRLKLSTAQVAQIRSIRTSTHGAMAAIHSNAGLSTAQRRGQIRDLRVASRKQMDALLTPTQRTRLAHLRARLDERLGGF